MLHNIKYTLCCATGSLTLFSYDRPKVGIHEMDDGEVYHRARDRAFPYTLGPNPSRFSLQTLGNRTDRSGSLFYPLAHLRDTLADPNLHSSTHRSPSSRPSL